MRVSAGSIGYSLENLLQWFLIGFQPFIILCVLLHGDSHIGGPWNHGVWFKGFSHGYDIHGLQDTKLPAMELGFWSWRVSDITTGSTEVGTIWIQMESFEFGRNRGVLVAQPKPYSCSSLQAFLYKTRRVLGMQTSFWIWLHIIENIWKNIVAAF